MIENKQTYDTAPSLPDDKSERVGYELQDAPAGRIFFIGFALLVLIGIVLGITWGLLNIFGGHPPRPLNPPSTMMEQSILPPEPRLQPNPVADLRKFQASEDSILHTYGWVDKKAGIARIPIDSAMKLALKNGFPVRERESSNEIRK